MVWKYVPKGRKNWYIGYRSGNREMPPFSTGTSNEKAAERIRSKIEVELAEGRFLDKKRRSTWTLGQLGKVYLARMAVAKPRSIAWRRDRFRQVERIVGKDTPIESISDSTLDRIVASRLEAGTSLATAKEDVAVLRHAIGQAYRWQGETGLSEYRLAGWRPPEDPRPPKKPEAFDPGAWKKTLAAARKRAARGRWADVHGLAVILLARTLGARRGEVLGLLRSDVDLKSGLVRRKISKKRKPEERETLIDGEALKLLRRVARLHDRELLFANPQTGEARKDIKAYWTAVRKDAGVTERFHAIRHAFGRDFLKGGGSIRELQDRLGHSSIRTTEKYSHLVKRRKPPKGLPIE